MADKNSYHQLDTLHDKPPKMTLPQSIEDIIFCFAFQQLDLDELLATMPNNDISDTRKKAFDNMIAQVYKNSFGRSAKKYPLGFWNQIELHIQNTCGLHMPRQYPFCHIYTFLEHMQ